MILMKITNKSESLKKWHLCILNLELTTSCANQQTKFPPPQFTVAKAGMAIMINIFEIHLETHSGLFVPERPFFVRCQNGYHQNQPKPLSSSPTYPILPGSRIQLTTTGPAMPGCVVHPISSIIQTNIVKQHCQTVTLTFEQFEEKIYFSNMKSDLDQYVPNLTARRPLCLLAGVHRLWENFHKSGRGVHIPRYSMQTMLLSGEFKFILL